VLFIIVFGTLLFPVANFPRCRLLVLQTDHVRAVTVLIAGEESEFSQMRNTGVLCVDNLTGNWRMWSTSEVFINDNDNYINNDENYN